MRNVVGSVVVGLMLAGCTDPLGTTGDLSPSVTLSRHTIPSADTTTITVRLTNFSGARVLVPDVCGSINFQVLDARGAVAVGPQPVACTADVRPDIPLDHGESVWATWIFLAVRDGQSPTEPPLLPGAYAVVGGLVRFGEPMVKPSEPVSLTILP